MGRNLAGAMGEGNSKQRGYCKQRHLGADRAGVGGLGGWGVGFGCNVEGGRIKLRQWFRTRRLPSTILCGPSDNTAFE